MRYLIALALAALMTSGIFYLTPSFASEDDTQEEQSIEEGQQEDVEMMQDEDTQQMNSDDMDQSGTDEQQ